MPDFYTRYSPPPHAGAKFEGPSLTQQHFKDDCDINLLIQRYGMLAYDPLHPPTIQPQFGDFDSVDFQLAQIKIAQASQAFDLLPSDLRKRFNNSPVELLQFLEKEENRNAAIELGLISQPSDPNLTSASSPVPAGQAI